MSDNPVNFTVPLAMSHSLLFPQSHSQKLNHTNFIQVLNQPCSRTDEEVWHNVTQPTPHRKEAITHSSTVVLSARSNQCICRVTNHKFLEINNTKSPSIIKWKVNHYYTCMHFYLSKQTYHIPHRACSQAWISSSEALVSAPCRVHLLVSLHHYSPLHSSNHRQPQKLIQYSPSSSLS